MVNNVTIFTGSDKTSKIIHKGGHSILKSTGIVRKVDELGRIVLPKELRSTLNIQEKDPLEIFVEDSDIILRKYQPACIFCNSLVNITTYRGHNICQNCLKKLASLSQD